VPALRTCHGRGFLASSDEWLPEDPHERFGLAHGFAVIGCNRLVCELCGERVRSGLGLEVARLAPLELYQHGHALRVGAGEVGARVRSYACRCFATLAHTSESLILESDAVELGPCRWRCAGHPPLELPGRFAGLELGAAPDWDALVDEHLGACGEPPVHDRLATHPGFLLTRLYQALVDDDAAALGQAVGRRAASASLTATERAGAALFFAHSPMAPGLESLLAAWRADPGAWDEVPSLWGPDREVRAVILEATAFRFGRHQHRGEEDPVALDALRWAALTPPGLGSQVYWLEHIDADWAFAHLEGLAAAAPADWRDLFFALQTPSARLLLPACLRVLASGHATREELVGFFKEKLWKYPGLAEAIETGLKGQPA